MIIFAFASMLIALLAVIFALSNTAPASVNFVVWSFQGSLALILLGALFSGILISFLGTLPSLVRNRWTIRQLRKKLQAAEDILSEHNLTAIQPAAHSADSKRKPDHPTRAPVEPASKPVDTKPRAQANVETPVKPIESALSPKPADTASAAKSSGSATDSPAKQ
jgi:lipopolysaccharide assembly protein A